MTTFRIATSSGDGSFSASERGAASGSHLSGSDFNSLAGRSGVTALVGRFNGSALADIALVGGDNWNSIPTALFSESTGTITVTTRNSTVQGFAAAARGREHEETGGRLRQRSPYRHPATGTSERRHHPGALSDGGGNYRDGSLAVSGHLSAAQFNSLALQPGVKVIVGDYDGDGWSDVALTAEPAGSRSRSRSSGSAPSRPRTPPWGRHRPRSMGFHRRRKRAGRSSRLQQPQRHWVRTGGRAAVDSRGSSDGDGMSSVSKSTVVIRRSRAAGRRWLALETDGELPLTSCAVR